MILWANRIVRCGELWMWPIMAAILIFPAATCVAAETNAIEMSISPFLPPHVLLTSYAPMRAYLERELKHPVSLVTAPDYRVYNERILRGEPAFLIAVASSAQLAIEDKGYVPYLRPEIYTRPILIVAQDSVIQRVTDLHGRLIVTTDRMAVVAMQGIEMLRKAGLTPDRDVTLRHLANHAAAINYVISHDADAAIVSDRALAQMPTAQQQSVRIIADWKPGSVPGVVYLARADISAEQIMRMKNAISEFVSNTDEGRAMMEATGYGNLVPTDAKELSFLAPYAAELRSLLNASNAK